MEKINKKTAFVVILAAIILLAALIANFTAKNPANKPLVSSRKYEVPAGNNFFLGTSSPRLTVVEFSDFACPYCRDSYAVVREMSLKYKNSIKIIYRDYPLHENSVELALAARCAGEQGLFWPMYDKLFSRQEKFSTSSLPDLAVSVGADAKKFSGCLKEKKYLSSVKKDYSDGQSLGIRGTPTFFFNGYRAEGEIPKDKFEQIINQFLK
jgi:protein-disulfide isomerase